MNRVNSSSSRGPVGITGPGRSGRDSSGVKTAEKISEISVPAGFGRRDAILLRDVRDLCKKVKSEWNTLDPDELDQKMDLLEKKVALFEESTPTIDRVKKVVGELRFMSLLPAAREVYVCRSEESMPDTFATTMRKTEKQTVKMNSLKFFEQLNPIQQREVLRYSVGG